MSQANARRTDPITSHEAALRAERNDAKTQRRLCYEALLACPGMTSAEVAQKTGLDRYQAARRLPDLREDDLARNGEMRVCKVKRTRAITWYATPGRQGQTRLF